MDIQLREESDRLEPLRVFTSEPLPSNLITRVNRNRSNGYYGAFDATILAPKAAELIATNSDAQQQPLVEVLKRLLARAEADCVAEAVAGEKNASAQLTQSCWLCIRMTLPTDEWVVPRWHTDGRMFDCTCPDSTAPHSKYAFTILGPPTRVMFTSPDAHKILKSPSPSGRRWNANDPDPELAKALESYPQAAIEPGQMIRFSWAQQDSPIHSEPDSTDMHRVFVSILFGTESELRDMCNFRGETYGEWY
ncbi:unnamed protein product [Clonostachys rosea]|uniref:JmjC domain-containing protein n=1 Tax=Bionectria ochroleuca TaxID=29856 RepID=A0ABY6U579_BIOOC|nr:unnamed protein product [Clonostachys rosea]